MHPTIITDIHDPKLDVYARLSENELLHLYEPNGGIFIAESPKVIARALEAGYEPISLLMQEKDIEKDEENLVSKLSEIPIYTGALEVLKELTGFPLTRGMLCAMHRKPNPDVKEILKSAKRIAVLENIENPTNVGAIVRSAAALHMDAILFTPGCADPLYRRAIRVSMGTIFQIPFAFLGKDMKDWEEHGISYLHDLGFSTAAMALCEDTLSIDDPQLMTVERLAIILGTEGDGLCQNTISHSDYTVKIPMSHNVDSLNVAAASAVAFYQLSKHN